MRVLRILLLVVVVSTAAGVFASSAGALAFADLPCPVTPPSVVKVCPNGEVGKAYSLHVDGRTGTGCYPNVKYTVVGGTALPPGLSLSSDGWITGTPTTAGKYDFWLQMQDTAGTPSWCGDNEATQRLFELTVVQGLQIVERQSTLTPAQVATPYSLQFHTTGGGSPTFSVASGTLPQGLTLSSGGLLSGTATTTGDYSFQVKAQDGDRTDAQTYAISVVQPLKITAPAGTAGEVNRPFNLALAATGGKQAYTWSVATGSTLPDGLTLDPATGTISGTPTTAGATVTKVTVTDSLGLTNTVDVKLAVAQQLSIVKNPLRPGKVGRKYRARLFAQGGVVPKQWTILRGALPAGLRLNAATGVISGTPRHAGTKRVIIKVTDKLGAVSRGTYVLKVVR
jgi:Putative Ig domain